MSGRLSLTAPFCLSWFLAFYCFKCCLVSFSSAPNIIPPKYDEQDQIDAKWLEKKFIFWRESRRAGRSLIIVNESIKETDNLIFQCKIAFYFTHEHQNSYFHSWLPPHMKILLLVSILSIWSVSILFAQKLRLIIVFNSGQSESNHLWFFCFVQNQENNVTFTVWKLVLINFK